MANFFNKIKINSAVDLSTTCDLSKDHITTMDFFTPKITYFKEVVPGEQLDINVESYTRLQPLTVPTFGRLQMVHRSFFVPMRVIMKDWNAFITGAINEIGKSTKTVTKFRNCDLVKYILGFEFDTETNTGWYVNKVDDTSYDICAYTTTNNYYEYYKLTDKGRILVDRLNCLGIKLNWNEADTTEISFLPVLAFCKVMEDWYRSSQYEFVCDVDKFVNTMLSSSNKLVDFSSISDTTTEIYQIMEMFTYTGSYAQDYFTSAWNNPSGPNQGLMTGESLRFPDVNTLNSNMDYTTATVGVSEQDKAAYADTGGDNVLTQYAVDALKKLSDFLKRNQLAGGKALDRYLARFGKQLSSEKLNRSDYLGANSLPIKVGDIMSNSDTEGAVLGAYAGTGVGYSDQTNFKLRSDEEYGYFVIITQIIPRIGYVQGTNRAAFHLDRTSFWQPEFDSLGSQAISIRELYQPMDNLMYSNFAGSANSNKIFGFTPRYAEYKVAQDTLSGDYQFTSRNTGEDSWYTFRMMPWLNSEGPEEASNYAIFNLAGTRFLEGADGPFTDKDQYNRIFNAGADSYIADHFRCVFHFNVKATLPMASLYDNYEFEDKGREVTMQVNGTNLSATN